MIGAYGISVTGFFAIRQIFGETLNLVAVVNNFVHLMLLPSLVLLPLALIMRRPLVIVTLLFPFGMTLYYHAPLFTNENVLSSPEGTTVRVMTYNLLARSGGLDPAIEMIRTSDADIVTLQEVGFSAAARIESELTDMYPHQSLYPNNFTTRGQGVISKYPIIETEYILSDWLVNYLGHQRVTIDLDSTTVAVYNLHPVHPLMVRLDVSVRWDDLEGILARAMTDSELMPTLLMGDFNLTPFTEDYERITAAFTDSYREVGYGLGYTFPNASAYGSAEWIPRLARLDYVFYDAHWQAAAAQVGENSFGSDHYPLTVELVLLGE